MATGSPVSFWYGTRAQFDSITTKLDTTLYFITDEQALYKGTVKFSGSGVDTLLTISDTEPTASSVTTGDKYFNTSDNLIHVLKNENGTVTTTATYEPANGALYYNADAQRFQTLIKDGSSYIPTEIYDAGISVEDDTGLALNGTTVSGLDATTSSKGVIQVGSNLNVSDGVLSVPTATNARFGVVKPGDNITNNNGVLSVAKATASSLGVVKPGDNINVDNNGQISVPVANGNTKGVVSAGANVNNNNGVLSVSTASTGSQGVIKIADPFSCGSSGILEIADATTSSKGVVKVGTNIDVADGVISIKDASTSDKGVVQLTSDLDDIYSNTLAATPALVDTVTADLDGRKQDSISCEAPINLDVNRISLAYGDGLAVGVTGTTNANKLIVNEASVKEVLEDVVDGDTEPAVNEIVTADNIHGALSVGQAVDVSCAPYKTGGTITYDADGFLGGFTCSLVSGNTVGFYDTTDHKFPKYAEDDAGNPLHYLFIADVSGTGTITPNGEDAVVLSSTPKRISMEVTAKDTGYFSADTNANVVVSNWRQYEVNALTEKAKDYLASDVTNPNPDALFRSSSTYSIMNKYLIKQDMVCPFIPTIKMPDNSDLTVAAGLSYKIKYTNDNPHTITADTIPSDGYGWDTHVQLFIKGTSGVVFQQPLILMDALTPNAGHNLSIKWRNGDALVYVDDTDAGYVVSVTSGVSTGSLYLGLTGNTSGYVVFGTETNGRTCTFDTASVPSDMSLIGNGTNMTAIEGDITIASNKLVHMQDLKIVGSTVNGPGSLDVENIAMSSIVSNAPTAFSANVTIDDGSTISGAGTFNFASPVVMNGSNAVFDLQDTDYIRNTNGLNVDITGVTFQNGTGEEKVTSAGTANEKRTYWGGVFGSHYDIKGNFTSCTFINNTALSTANAEGNGAIFYRANNAYYDLVFTDCTFMNNYTTGDGSVMYLDTPTSYGKIDLINCTITGCTAKSDGALYLPGAKQKIRLIGCTITGNTASRSVVMDVDGECLIEDCDITGNTGGSLIWLSSSSAYVTIRNTRIGSGDLYVDNGSTLVLGGTVAFVGNTLDFHHNANDTTIVEDNAVLDVSEHTGNANFLRGASERAIKVGNNVQFITANSSAGLIDKCECRSIEAPTNGAPVNFISKTILLGNDEGVCRAHNVIFKQVIDAHEVSTLVLKDVTFTSNGQFYDTVNQPSRIQLTGATVSYPTPGYRNPTTRVVIAPVVVVGENPANPSGSITYIDPAGSSFDISGIGSYINVNGTNDFVANNTTNVVPVDGSTDGAKYLGTVLSATTGDTGANRFAKIDSGAVAVVNTGVNAVNKGIITHDYEPILGGTFSLTSATVNEATKTVAIQSGGTMSIVNVRGGKDSVIDLGGTYTAVSSGITAYVGGCTVSGGSIVGYGGFMAVCPDAVASITDTTITGNTCTGGGGGIYVANGGVLLVSGCIVSGNSANSLATGGAIYVDGGTASVTSSVVSGNAGLTPNKDMNVGGSCVISASTVGIVGVGSNGVVKIQGNNTITQIKPNSAGVTGGSVTISSGASINLTSSIAPGGAVTINCSGTKIVTDTRTVTIDGTGSIYCLQINNDGTIVVNNGHRSISPGLTFTNASFSSPDNETFYLSSAGTITFVNCEFTNTSCYTTTSNGQTGCDIIISGTLKTNMFRTFYPNTGDSTTCIGTVTIADGCIITANLGSSVNAIMTQIATLVVGTGVKVNGYAVTGGTYTNVSLNKDGTITQVG